MDFENGNLTSNSGNDVVERFIRTLINRNELSLARNIIGSLGENYNHLLFELEVQAGNYKKALEIFNYLPKEKQQMYIHIADTIEKDAEKVSEAFGNLIKNLQSENFPIFIAEAQKLKKDYPQIIEVIALELIAAVRRGDKKKIRALSDILEQLDKSHPALSQVKKSKNLISVFAPAILIALFVIVLSNLIISIFSLSASDIAAFSNLNKQITNIGKSLENLSSQNAQNNSQLKSLSESIENLKQSLEKINILIEESKNLNANQNPSQDSVSNDAFAKMNDELDKFKKNLETVLFHIRSLDSKVSALGSSGKTKTDTIAKAPNNIDQERLLQSVKSNEAKINKLLNDFAELKNSIASLTKNVDVGSTSKYSNEYENKISELILSIEKIGSEIDQIKANMKETNYQNYQSNDNGLAQVNITLQNLLKAIDNVQKQISSLSTTSIEKPENIEEVSTLKGTLNSILQQLDEIKNQLDGKIQLQSAEINDSKKTTNDSTQDIVAIKNRLDVLEQKIEEMKNAMNKLKVPELQTAAVNSNEINELKAFISNLEKSIGELKKSMTDSNQDVVNIRNKLNSLEQKVDEIKNSVNTLKSSEKQPNDVSNSELSNIKASVSNLEKLIGELKKSATDSNQDVASLKNKLNSLEQKVEEIKSLVSALKTPEKQPNEVGNSDLSNLKASVSNLEKAVGELKNSLRSISDQITDLKSNISEVNKSTKVENTTQKSSNLSDVERVIKETKDLYELYRAGVGYYSNKLYQEALYVLGYVQDQLEGIDIYFKEDVYYYQVMSYLKLGDKQNAQKKFQDYKKAFPNGRYVNELSALF